MQNVPASDPADLSCVDWKGHTTDEPRKTHISALFCFFATSLYSFSINHLLAGVLTYSKVSGLELMGFVVFVRHELYAAVTSRIWAQQAHM